MLPRGAGMQQHPCFSHRAPWQGGQPGDLGSTRLKITTSPHSTPEPDHGSTKCSGGPALTSVTSTPGCCLFFHPSFNLSTPNQVSCTSYKPTVHLFLNTSSLVKLTSNGPAERQQSTRSIFPTEG